jgi:hypothetical protein
MAMKRILLFVGVIVGGCNSSSSVKAPPGVDAAADTKSNSQSGADAAASSGGAGAAGGVAGSVGVGATGGVSGTGGAIGTGGTTTQTSDAGDDSNAKLDTVAGGASAGGAGGGGDIGTGGLRSDAAFDVGLDLRVDAAADSSRDAGADSYGSSDATTSDGAPCPYVGHVTYTLTKSAAPTAAELAAYALITPAMDKAVYYYNCYTNITKSTFVTYDPGVPTADGNSNGSIRFGGTVYMEYITAMHEIAHTVGVGTASNWRSFVAIPDAGGSGPWTGTSANAQLRAITGVATQTLTADTMHFWPYGLNYTSEVKSEADVIDHCKMVVAIRKDLGLQ